MKILKPFWFVLVTVALGYVTFCVAKLCGVIRPSDGDKKQRPYAAADVCPDHNGVFIRTEGGDTATIMNLAVSGGATGIPEFHDCQRMILDDGIEYGPMIGIFARYQGTQTQVRITPNQLFDFDGNKLALAGGGARKAAGITFTGGPQVTTQTGPFAVLEAISSGAYDLLGIHTGANCLYMQPDNDAPSGLAAVMVQVSDEKECAKGVNEVSGMKKSLSVYALAMDSDLGEDDVPPVARWHWDKQHDWQIIGTKCGASWCLIGPEGLRVAGPHNPPDGSSGHVSRRVFRVPGWFDEQRMGVKLSNGKIGPGVKLGTAFPTPELGRFNDVSDFTRWQHVANVDFPEQENQYQSKLGFTKTKDKGPYNKVELCQGGSCTFTGGSKPTSCTSDAEGLTWYAKVTTPEGVPTYRCVNHHSVIGYDPPATARWRWWDTDETLWTRCALGCCEVTGDM